MHKLIPILLAILITGLLPACEEKAPPAPAPAQTSPQPQPAVHGFDSTSPYYVNVDVSPMDMSYYPVNYPKLKMANRAIPPPVMRVIYSRPHLAGRELFHDVLKYGEHWRLGANESTEIDFYQPVTIQQKTIRPGRYIIYCVLGATTWTIVLNSSLDSWGLQQDTTRDVERFVVPVTHGNPTLEYYTMEFEKTAGGADLIMAWDDVVARLPIRFSGDAAGKLPAAGK